MDVREKLVKLLKSILPNFRNNMAYWGEKPIYEFADCLLANGVTVQELDGCKYCKEYEDLPEHFIDGNPVGRVFDTCIQRNENGLWHLEVPCGADIGIRFCPMCGRRLPQQLPMVYGQRTREYIQGGVLIMDIREKLEELLTNAIIDSDDNYGFPDTNQVADHLIAHGVTVQECKLGDKKSNADKIRGMSDGELLELLSMIYATGKADGFALAKKQWQIDFELTSKWLMQEDE